MIRFVMDKLPLFLLWRKLKIEVKINIAEKKDTALNMSNLNSNMHFSV